MDLDLNTKGLYLMFGDIALCVLPTAVRYSLPSLWQNDVLNVVSLFKERGDF